MREKIAKKILSSFDMPEHDALMLAQQILSLLHQEGWKPPESKAEIDDLANAAREFGWLHKDDKVEGLEIVKTRYTANGYEHSEFPVIDKKSLTIGEALEKIREMARKLEIYEDYFETHDIEGMTEEIKNALTLKSGERTRRG